MGVIRLMLKQQIITHQSGLTGKILPAVCRFYYPITSHCKPPHFLIRQDFTLQDFSWSCHPILPVQSSITRWMAQNQPGIPPNIWIQSGSTTVKVNPPVFQILERFLHTGFLRTEMCLKPPLCAPKSSMSKRIKQVLRSPARILSIKTYKIDFHCQLYPLLQMPSIFLIMMTVFMLWVNITMTFSSQN